MPIGNVKLPSLKAPNFKVVDMRAPNVKIGVKMPKTAITAKAARPATIKKVK